MATTNYIRLSTTAGDYNVGQYIVSGSALAGSPEARDKRSDNERWLDGRVDEMRVKM